MATGQTLLDTMELLDQELQLQPGEVDVVRGLTALNRSQDYFESLLATRPKALGSTVGAIQTVANTESTAFPTGVLRLDRISLLSGSGGRPLYDLGKNQRAGTMGSADVWPFSFVSTTASGRPTSYKANGGAIYWNPLPDTVYYLRWEGFQVASDISASGTFAYPDIVILPLASFAVKLFKLGVDDAAEQVDKIAQEIFRPCLDALSRFNRDGGVGLEFRHSHTE